MGNLHSYYGDVSASSTSTTLSPSSDPPSGWEHRLDQLTLRSLFVHHARRVVSHTHPSYVAPPAPTPSAPPPTPYLDLFFADLPPAAYSHGVHHDILALLAQSTPSLSPHSSAFLRLTSASHTRLSRQLHELVYHHVNHSLMHALTTAEQLQHTASLQRNSLLLNAFSLLHPSPTAEVRDELTQQARAHLKSITSRTQGRSGRKLLTSSLLEALERPRGVGCLYPVAEERPLKELSRELTAASHEQLTKDELTVLIRASLSLAAQTMSAGQALQTVQCVVASLRLYGDMRLPMFSALTRLNHELLPVLVAQCRESTAEERAWKAAVMGRLQDALSLLTSNDREKERERDREKETVAFSFTAAFVLLHLALIAETHQRQHLHPMDGVTGQCSPTPQYAPFAVPFVLDFSPESVALQVDVLSTLIHLRPEPSLPALYRTMYHNIRTLFPPSPTHPNSIQTVRLLLPLLSSLLANPSSLLCRQFKFGAHGPFFECIEEFAERKEILLMLGFRVVERRQGKAEESKERERVGGAGEELEWFADEAQIDLPLLRFAVQQLTRLNAAHYEQHPPKSPLDSLTASSALSTSILSLLSLLRVQLQTAKVNRVSPALLSRSDVLCAGRQPMMTALVDALLMLIGRDEVEYAFSDGDRGMEQEKACDLLCLAFPLLPSAQQLRLLHHALVSAPLRVALLQLLSVEPMAFCFFPFHHTPSTSPSAQSVWERICKGVNKEKSMAAYLSDPDVVSFLIAHHDQGVFSLQHSRRHQKGKVTQLCDWLAKSSATPVDDVGVLSASGEVSASLPGGSPVLASSTMSEEKKEVSGAEPPPSPTPLTTVMPSPPLLSFARSSSFPSIDSVEVTDFHSLLDLFFYYLTSPTTPQATRDDLQLLLLHLQRCLLTRALVPLNAYDRSHTPLLLCSYASSLFLHANDFLTALKHRHSTSTLHRVAPMTSLSPSFPPAVALPPTYQAELDASPFAFLLSSLMPPFAFLASLPRLSLPLDEQLLGSLRAVLELLGGYSGLDDDAALQQWVARDEQRRREELKEDIDTPPAYGHLHERLAVSSVLIEPFLASTSANAAFTSALAMQGEKGKALMGAIAKVRDERQLHHLSIESLHLLDSFVFPLDNRLHHDFTRDRPHSQFVSHVTFPSLYVCPACGLACPSALELLRHPQSNGLCSSPASRFSLLHHSTLWLLAKVSRHMAASYPTKRFLHSVPPRDRPKDADERERPMTGVEDMGGPQLPKTVDQWLSSELIKSGLEDSYVTAPTASILPPLAVSATSSFAPSVSVSMPGTPRTRSIPMTAMPPVMGPSSQLFGGSGEMTLPPSSSLSESTQPHPPTFASTLPSEFNKVGAEIQQKTSPRPGGRSASPSSSSSATTPVSGLYEKGDSEKVVEDLASKGSVTVESPRVSITMSLSTISREDEARVGAEKLSSSLLSDKARDPFVRLQVVATEPYEHARWLHELIYGDNEAGELDAALMSSPSMLMYATKRRMVGKRAVECSRAIIACLLKHLNKMELALDEWSLHQDDRAHAWSPSLLKAWKQGSEVLTDMIAAHQQGMQYLCASKGCDCEAQETHDNQGKEKFKCSAGHLNDRCLEREAQTYDSMAERVMRNAHFLLQLRPSLASSASLQMQRYNSMRVRKILRVRPPLPNPSPEPSPLFDPQERSRQRRRKAADLQLKPQPQLTWSSTSAASHQLLVPSNAPVSPVSAPLPEKRKTADDSQVAGSDTPPEATTPEQPPGQRIPRRASVGMIPTRIDDSLAPRAASAVSAAITGGQRREKLKAAVKRELQASKWKELREELLLHRNSFVSLLSRVPLSSLVLSFAKDFSPATSHLTENLDLALRSAVLRAERRVKGLESLCLLIKSGGMGAKMLALSELHIVLKEWTVEKEQPKAGTTAAAKDKAAEVSSASFFPSSSASSSSTALTPLPFKALSIQRYDNGLLTCGSARLAMISDAFYVLSGVNVNLMRQCINVLLTTAIAGGGPSLATKPRSPPPLDSRFSLELIGSEQAQASLEAAEVDPQHPHSPPFSSQGSGGLSCSSSLALLLSCLNCWQVAFHRVDFTFLRNTGILAVVDLLIQSYPSLPLPPSSVQPLLPLDSLDLTRVQEVGRKSRSVFRLLVLSCLTAEPVQLKRGEEDDEAAEREWDSPSRGSAGGDKKDGEDSIAVDSFESSLLNSIFARLETIVTRLHQRADKARPSGTQTEEEDGDREAHDGARRRMPGSGRSIRSQLTSFTLPAEQQFEQDESDCAELLCLLLLSCASARIRLSLTHSPADSTPPSPALLSPFSSFSLPLSARCLYLLLSLTSSTSFVSLSPRCIRHTLRICQQLLPLLTPATVDSVFANLLDSLSDDDDGESSQHSPFVQHLLTSVGYFTCGRFLERPTFTCPASHSQTIASELTGLLRLLCCSSSWQPTVSLALTAALRHLRHRQFPVTDAAARVAFYRGWGALSVFGGGSEEDRVGVSVRVQRVTERNEKLSKARLEEAGDSRVGSVIGHHHHGLVVVYDDDPQFERHLVSRTQCTFLPLIPCLHPVHLGRYGAANLSSVVSYINQAFSTSSSSSVFALYPPSLHGGEADSRDQQVHYVHSLQKVHAVKVLCYAISHALSTSTSLAPLLQAILRDPTASPASAASTGSTLMSNLLSIAQNVIPLTQGVGLLPSLDAKQTALHALLHDRPLPPAVPSELKALSIHVDLCHRALFLFGGQLPAAVAWLKGKHIGIKLSESAAKRESVSEVVRGLQEMGFSTSLCQKALLLCNGDSNQAVSWLLEHGMTAMEDARNGLPTESWGLEGVDFYQERGHTHFDFELDRQRTQPSNNDLDGGVTGEGVDFDPFRRLTLKTAPRMKEQSALNERYRLEQQGLDGRTTITCSLDEDDVRVGQLLRVNAAWCVSERNAEVEAARAARAAAEEYRWFFLTEDNNWAPLDAKDMRLLDDTLQQRHSTAWVGVEEKTPSLIRLDKMCMYNELTGHGRPLKRKRVERPEGAPVPPHSTEPPVPVSLYSSMSADMQAKAVELAVMGFPLSHCARALIETRGNSDAAANWIIANEAALAAMDREDERRKLKREQWEEKQKEAASAVAAAASSSSSSSSPAHAAAADLPVSHAAIYPHAGQLGVVQQLSPSRRQVLMAFIDPDTAHVSSVWLPIAACEWDDSAIIHQLPELNNRRFQGLAGLALDVASSEFILYARRCVLLILYALSSDKTGGGKSGRVELIKVHCSAHSTKAVPHLARLTDSPCHFPPPLSVRSAAEPERQRVPAHPQAGIRGPCGPHTAHLRAQLAEQHRQQGQGRRRRRQPARPLSRLPYSRHGACLCLLRRVRPCGSVAGTALHSAQPGVHLRQPRARLSAAPAHRRPARPPDDGVLHRARRGHRAPVPVLLQPARGDLHRRRQPPAGDLRPPLQPQPGARLPHLLPRPGVHSGARDLLRQRRRVLAHRRPRQPLLLSLHHRRPASEAVRVRLPLPCTARGHRLQGRDGAADAHAGLAGAGHDRGQPAAAGHAAVLPRVQRPHPVAAALPHRLPLPLQGHGHPRADGAVRAGEAAHARRHVRDPAARDGAAVRVQHGQRVGLIPLPHGPRRPYAGAAHLPPDRQRVVERGHHRRPATRLVLPDRAEGGEFKPLAVRVDAAAQRAAGGESVPRDVGHRGAALVSQAAGAVLEAAQADARVELVPQGLDDRHQRLHAVLAGGGRPHRTQAVAARRVLPLHALGQRHGGQGVGGQGEEGHLRRRRRPQLHGARGRTQVGRLLPRDRARVRRHLGQQAAGLAGGHEGAGHCQLSEGHLGAGGDGLAVDAGDGRAAGGLHRRDGQQVCAPPHVADFPRHRGALEGRPGHARLLAAAPGAGGGAACALRHPEDDLHRLHARAAGGGFDAARVLVAVATHPPDRQDTDLPAVQNVPVALHAGPAVQRGASSVRHPQPPRGGQEAQGRREPPAALAVLSAVRAHRHAGGPVVAAPQGPGLDGQICRRGRPRRGRPLQRVAGRHLQRTAVGGQPQLHPRAAAAPLPPLPQRPPRRGREPQQVRAHVVVHVSAAPVHVRVHRQADGYLLSGQQPRAAAGSVFDGVEVRGLRAADVPGPEVHRLPHVQHHQHHPQPAPAQADGGDLRLFVPRPVLHYGEHGGRGGGAVQGGRQAAGDVRQLGRLRRAVGALPPDGVQPAGGRHLPRPGLHHPRGVPLHLHRRAAGGAHHRLAGDRRGAAAREDGVPRQRHRQGPARAAVLGHTGRLHVGGAHGLRPIRQRTQPPALVGARLR